MAALLKDAQVGFRLAVEDKTLLEQAAQRAGLNLSDFVLSMSVQAASNVLERQRLVVSPQEFERFLTALEADIPPTEAALRAAERFRNGQVSANGSYRAANE